MVCSLLAYSTLQKGCIGIGETCEVCKPLFYNPVLVILFLIVITFLLTIIISISKGGFIKK